ncbi:MAG: hypothetical protein AAF416_18380 [Pseudomonadota bacterium]
MFELLKTWRTRLRTAFAFVFCHRAIYAGLSACHGSGCLITEKPELYGPMAVLYAILALRG